MIFQIFLTINAKSHEIRRLRERLDRFRDLRERALQMRHFLQIQKMNTAHIHAERTLDAARTRFDHVSPVANARRNKRVGGNAGNRVVPIFDFYRSQRNITHNAVHALARNLNPIVLAHDIVEQNRQSRGQTQQRIAENDEQHRHCRAERRKKINGRLVRQNREHQQRRSRDDDVFRRFDKTFERERLAARVCNVKHPCVQQSANHIRNRNRKINFDRNVAKTFDDRVARQKRRQIIQKQHGRDHLKKLMRHARADDKIVETVFRLFRQSDKINVKNPRQRTNANPRSRENSRQNGESKNRHPSGRQTTVQKILRNHKIILKSPPKAFP